MNNPIRLAALLENFFTQRLMQGRTTVLRIHENDTRATLQRRANSYGYFLPKGLQASAPSGSMAVRRGGAVEKS
jgi:hypothetical protein